MMRQYQELKRRYPDHILLFRLGDFYETFFEDAELAARLLQITLTARQGAPMAGIPHHAADGYIARLVHAGQKIAVCEQLEAPGRENKLLRRDVVKIITPGTLTDTAYLEGAANNFLLAVSAGRDSIGVALVDVSTGEFWAGEDTGKGTEILATALLRRPAEILLPDTARADPVFLARLQATGAALTFCDPATFAPRRAGHAHGRASPAPVALAPTPRSGGDRRAPGRGRRPGRGAGRAGSAHDVAIPDRRPRAADQPRDARPGPRPRPGRPSRMSGAAAGHPAPRGPARGSRDRRGGRRAGAARRPARALDGGARGRAAPRAPRRRRDPRELARRARRDRPRRARGAGVDRRARGAGASADRDLESAGPFQSSVRLRHRGDARPGFTRARRVRASPDAHRRRALRDPGAQGVRGESARRRRAAPPARVRAVRGGAPQGGGARRGPHDDR